MSVDRTDLRRLVVLVGSGDRERSREWLREQVGIRLSRLESLLWHASLEAELLFELRRELDELLLDATRNFGSGWVERQHGRREEAVR